MYAQNCKDEKVSLAQTSSDQGNGREFGKGTDFEGALTEAQKFQKKYAEYTQIPDNELPA
jgi:hypothetical protein